MSKYQDGPEGDNIHEEALKVAHFTDDYPIEPALGEDSDDEVGKKIMDEKDKQLKGWIKYYESKRIAEKMWADIRLNEVKELAKERGLADPGDVEEVEEGFWVSGKMWIPIEEIDDPAGEFDEDSKAWDDYNHKPDYDDLGEDE